MRILRIIASVDPRQGGPVEGLLRSMAEHSRSGHETEILTLDASDAEWTRHLPVHGMGPVARKYGYRPRLSRWVAAHRHRFDAAVVHGLWNHAALGGALAAARVGLPYVVFAHGMLDPWFRKAHPAKHLAKQVLWWAGQGKALNRAAEVLFTSEEERRLAEGVFLGAGYRGKVVAYGAAEPVDAGPPALEHPYLLFLGRVHRKKGCDLLLEAFARQAATRPEVHLVLAGPDEDRLLEGLLAQVADRGLAGRIHAVGMLTGAAKWGALAGAEAFVLPSHQENFGIAVAEALACGTPVLISDKVNVWREISAMGAGYVASDTLAGTGELLDRWFRTPPVRRREMRHAARACFDTHFRIERAAEALLERLKAAAGVQA